MPTFEVFARFIEDFRRLDAQQREAFLRARDALVADLRAGHGFRKGLRVKRVQGTTEVWEPTWAPDGRATWQYGPEHRPGEGADDPMIAQRLGVVGLAARMPVHEVYDLVTDMGMAVDAAMTSVENADPATLADLLLAAPQLGELPFVTPFLAAVRAVFTADPDAALADATELATQAAEQGTDTQRSAATARLRRLVRRQPEHATAVHAIIEILTKPVPAEPEPDDGT